MAQIKELGYAGCSLWFHLPFGAIFVHVEMTHSHFMLLGDSTANNLLRNIRHLSHLLKTRGLEIRLARDDPVAIAAAAEIRLNP